MACKIAIHKWSGEIVIIDAILKEHPDQIWEIIVAICEKKLIPGSLIIGSKMVALSYRSMESLTGSSRLSVQCSE